MNSGSAEGCPDGSPRGNWYEVERVLECGVENMEALPGQEILTEVPWWKSKAMARSIDYRMAEADLLRMEIAAKE